MLMIRKEQMDVFIQDFDNQFVKTMVEHLGENFPKQLEAQSVAKDDLEHFVSQGMTKARSYGIISDMDIRVFLECMVLLCPDFDEDNKHAWAGEILHNDNMEPSEKAEALNWQLLSEVDWE